MILKHGLRTTDSGLGIKHGLRYKTRTKHYGLGVKYGLGIKHGLGYEQAHTECKLHSAFSVTSKGDLFDMLCKPGLGELVRQSQIVQCIV